MNKTYPDLDALLQDDKRAKKYYDNLPDYVKEQINTRKDNINSVLSLVDYAQNLTQGDD